MRDETRSEEAARHLVYFAAERTLFGWIRTALGLMALGFVVDRFGLVLRHVGVVEPASARSSTFSFWAGTILVALGALMALAGAIRYASFAVRYRRKGSTEPGYGLSLAIVFAVAVVIAGIAITVFLVSAFH